MAWCTYSSALIGIALVAHFFIDKLQTKLPLHFGGYAEEGYEHVQKAFQQNFIDGWESEGASLAVFVKGRKVVDVWGGYADKQAARKWKRDTMSLTFSSTKAVAGLCIALLADRGRLKYDDLVSKYWKDFAKNDKGNITIEWVMTHRALEEGDFAETSANKRLQESLQAGLPYFDTEITEEMAVDHNLMRTAIENETPKLPPGTRFEYHALTYGWLVDQIIRHTDEKRRGVGQFLREEITGPNGIDYHIGLNFTEEHRVARVALISIADFLSEMWHDPYSVVPMLRIYTGGQSHFMKKMFSNPSWMDFIHKTTVNSPEQHAMEQAGALGIGNARSLASMFNLLVTGHLVGEETLARLSKPILIDADNGLGYRFNVGLGLLHYPMEGCDTHYIVGHSGYGCQQVTFDTKNNIVLAYVTNAMKANAYDGCRNYVRIHKAVYKAVTGNVN